MQGPGVRWLPVHRHYISVIICQGIPNPEQEKNHHQREQTLHRPFTKHTFSSTAKWGYQTTKILKRHCFLGKHPQGRISQVRINKKLYIIGLSRSPEGWCAEAKNLPLIAGTSHHLRGAALCNPDTQPHPASAVISHLTGIETDVEADRRMLPEATGANTLCTTVFFWNSQTHWMGHKLHNFSQ